MLTQTELEKHKLPLMEQFYTIQGEGRYAGRAAYFIRLAGCDVGCVWCDVKESWDTKNHPLVSIANILEEIKKTPTNFVVITGGEPAMYDLSLLVNALHQSEYEVAIETSGCYDLRGDIDWYCFSPKKFKKPIEEAYQKANELKIVIFHPSDFSWAEEHAAKINTECILYLQTEWSKKETILPLLIDYVKANPKWKISLQTHKYLDIP
ncbi:MAG: 7-carboxy-7-deazaguanine synthase QueE [Crocinitomicaceae bacterium]|nr:7-carboxy-7-deazaguanine synthase QueE [Crocinitomicaceae bacterium]